MNNSRRIYAIALVLVLGLVPFAAAQMMGGGMAADKADTTSPSGMMGMGMMHRMNGMMGDMSQHHKMMSGDFQNLETHFNKMMQIQDMSELKAEMKKHQEMMQNMHESADQQWAMCQNMMSMMHTAGMQGSMGTDSSSSDLSVPDSHDH